jgi:hypothetical protein
MGVALALKDFRVRSLDIDFNELSWKLADTSEDVFDYTFQLWRSESPEGPFGALTTTFQDKYLFIDNTLATGNRWRKYFYRMRIARVDDPTDFVDSASVSKDPDADLQALEIRRHMQLLFQEHAGRRCWVLPVRTFGLRCSCWNQNLRQRTRSGCKTCWDTGFVRGYLHPIEQWLQIDPSPKTKQNTNVGNTQQSNTTMRMAWYPSLKPDDLVIEAENRRWKVVSVTQTEKGRAALHQEVQLHEIPPKDIEFAIELDLGAALKDLWISPSRNFTNPQNLEAFMDSEMPNIFSLYERRRP